MDEDYYNNLIIKFFVDELNESEQRILMEWITLSDSNQEQFKSYEKIFDQSALYARDYDGHQAFDKVRKVTTDEQTQLLMLEKRPFLTRKKILTLIIILTLSFFFPYYLNRDAFHNSLKSSQLEMREYVNANGKRAIITLPDSSKVTLNGGSVLYFPEEFSTHKRQVILKGEAFFEIVSDSDRPFEVLAKGTVTRVLGTSFNMKAYDEDDQLTVAVVSGKVRVETNDLLESTQKVLSDLTKHQSMVYNPIDKSVWVGSDVESSTAWLNNRLIFNNLSLQEISKNLERVYNISPVFEKEELKYKRYSANFRSSVSLKELMYTLASSDHFDFEIDGNQLIFKK